MSWRLGGTGPGTISGNLSQAPPSHPHPQTKLKQITPRTEEEKTEHSVAAERRRMRLVYTDTIKDLLANYVIQDGERLRAGGSCVSSLPWAPTGMSAYWWPQACLALLPQGLLR